MTRTGQNISRSENFSDYFNNHLQIDAEIKKIEDYFIFDHLGIINGEIFRKSGIPAFESPVVYFYYTPVNGPTIYLFRRVTRHAFVDGFWNLEITFDQCI